MDKLYTEGYTQNRELSWLNFNNRILDEACDESVPLLERLNFIAIFTSNLDEFFQVRVGGLLNEEMNLDEEIDVRSGMDATEQLEAIHNRIKFLIDRRDNILDNVSSLMRKEGIYILNLNELSDREKHLTATYYINEIKPLLNPVISDKPDDIPSLDSGAVCIICRLRSDTGCKYGIVEIPSQLSTILCYSNVTLNSRSIRAALIKDIIVWSLEDLFYPFEIEEHTAVRINRNADVALNDSAKDKIREMRRLIKERGISNPDTVYIEGLTSKELREYIMDAYELDYRQAFATSCVSLNYVSQLGKILPEKIKEKISYEDFEPIDQLQLDHMSLIDTLKKHDILSAYPYDSMQPFLTLMKEASESDSVKEMRITIYRLASHPKIIEYLINAVNRGIKVKVLMELRARFDEQSNVDWAVKLRKAGCEVFFGSGAYKVHTKVFQVVVRDERGESYITQIGTGNYNEKTSKLYTDFSLITVNQIIGRDVNAFFDDIFKGRRRAYNTILTSPVTMRQRLVELIRREADKGNKGRIFIKCNSLTDEVLIRELMAASCMGCRIRMVVRGICCIIPGIPGYTENIQIVSVVGRFLEHSRVYIFGEGDDELMYISSADFMTRNMIKRMELACPIYSSELRDRIRRIVYLNFMDNVKGRTINSKGIYEKARGGSLTIDSQAELMKHRL